jgi:hypothetical protein
MDGDDVFPAEMPDDHLDPMVPPPMVPLDDDTAERLLAGRLHPEDAPPGYAEVARVLRAAAAPPSPEELAGREAALAGFRAARDGSGLGGPEGHVTRAGLRHRPAGVGARRLEAGRRPGARRPGARRRRAPMRARLVALALAGVLIAGGAWTGGGVWIADGALTALGLRSPSGGPGTGGPGSGAPGSGPGSGAPGPGSGAAGGSGSLRPVTNPVAGGRAPSLPSAGERAAARHGRGVISRGGGSADGARPGAHAKPPKAGKDRAGKPKPSTAQKAKPPKPEKGPAGAASSKPGKAKPLKGSPGRN